MSGPDQSPSRFVRQYALTQGRVRSHGADLEIDTLVKATGRGRSAHSSLSSEHRRIIDLALGPISIAEISAHLRLHLGIARVLVSDLASHGYVVVSDTVTGPAGPDLPTLERLLDDLQAL